MKQNTKLESEGAEFLVLGNLLIEGISCYKAYVNFPGYDLIATNVDTGKLAKIQVKSRWATNYDKSFPIKNFDCDFVVHVALNRGIRWRKGATIDMGKKDPLFFVFPIEIIMSLRNEKSNWGKTHIGKLDNLGFYQKNWHLIKLFLS